MATEDPVRQFLQDSGCGQHTIDGGLYGLVESWEQAVHSIEAGYSLGLDDYLNDLDGRQLIEQAMTVAMEEQRREFLPRITRADQMMQSLVEPVDGCLWGDAVAEEEGWTAQENWWYFSRPINADAELQAELDEALEQNES